MANKVELYNNGVLIGTDNAPIVSGGNWTYSIPYTADSGNDVLTAKAFVDNVEVASSGVRNVVVNSIGDATPTTGLVSDYDFTSTTGDLIDSVSARNGILNGTITRNGTSFEFNGSTGSGYININDNDDHSFVNGGIETPFTLRFKIRFKSLATQQGVIARRDSSAEQEYQIFLSNTTGLNFILYSSVTTDPNIRFVLPLSELAINTDYVFVLRYDASKTKAGIRLSKNGVSQTNVDAGATTYTGMGNKGTRTVFGRLPITGSDYLNAFLSEVRIHKGYEWTDAEVLGDANSLL